MSINKIGDGVAGLSGIRGIIKQKKRTKMQIALVGGGGGGPVPTSGQIFPTGQATAGGFAEPGEVSDLIVPRLASTLQMYAPSIPKILGSAYIPSTVQMYTMSLGDEEDTDMRLCEGRLTLETGVPISITDQVAKSTLYFTPYFGNRVDLFDGAAWPKLTFNEISLALSGLTTDKLYDVYVYNNAGTLALELSAAWTNDTTRATAYALQDGVPVKSGTTSRRLVGTIRATSATTTEDSLAKRFCWNVYNQVRRPMMKQDLTNSWAFAAGWRQAGGNAANQLDYVVGLPGVLIEVIAMGIGASAGDRAVVGIGLDTTTVNSSHMNGAYFTSASWEMQSHAHYKGYPGIGRHFVAWLEYSDTTGGTWLGDAGVANVIYQSGIHGSLMG